MPMWSSWRRVWAAPPQRSSRTDPALTVIVGADRNARDSGEDLNLRAVSLDTAANAAAAAGLAASGAVIMITGDWYWLDPTVALIIAAVIGYHAVNLISRVLTALRIPWRPAKKAPPRPRAQSSARGRCPIWG